MAVVRPGIDLQPGGRSTAQAVGTTVGTLSGAALYLPLEIVEHTC